MVSSAEFWPSEGPEKIEIKLDKWKEKERIQPKRMRTDGKTKKECNAKEWEKIERQRRDEEDKRWQEMDVTFHFLEVQSKVVTTIVLLLNIF